jgi:hypothetical protein
MVVLAGRDGAGQMRFELSSKGTAAGVLLAMTMLCGNASLALQVPTWRDLPDLNLCLSVSLERHLGPNPFSHIDDDYLVITSYEEKIHEAGEINRNEGFLNVYLVNGLFMHPDQPAGVIHDVELIVSKWVYDKDSTTKTVYQWGFTFDESNGLLERVIYQVIVEDACNTILSFAEKDLPEREVRKMQPYFDRAMDKMTEKAQVERMDGFGLLLGRAFVGA